MAPHPEVAIDERSLSPMALRDVQLAKTIVKRADDIYKQLAAAGAKPPQDFAGPGFQALFAIIGVAMTLMAIWFFFWAKNGGFKWRGKEDWEDYKSTVLRRKGPDGKTLSNATKSTRLGGGSVVHGGSYGAESSVGYTDETGTSVDYSETYRDAEEGKGGLRGGEAREKKKKRRDHTNDYKDPELRQYREEKAARVGGLNRQADGTYTDYSGSALGSDLGSNVSSKPLVNKEAKDPKKEAKAKEQRARERMKKAKAAEKEAQKAAEREAKALKEAEKAEAKRAKDEQKKMKKARSNAALSEAPEMAEVTRPMIEYPMAATEYTAPSEYQSEYTDVSVPAPAPAPKRQSTHKGPSGPRRAPSAAYSFTTGDDDNATVYTGLTAEDTKSATKKNTKANRGAPSEVTESSYYSDYRPRADPAAYKTGDRSRSARPSTDRTSRHSQSNSQSASRPRPSGSRSRPTSESPTKQHRTSSQSPVKQHRTSQRPAPPQSDIFTAANGDSRGHMSYPCHIPGLSSSGRSQPPSEPAPSRPPPSQAGYSYAASSVSPFDSVSQAGGPRRERGNHSVMDGYRRGGVRAVGRRDSLSDSDVD